MKTILITGASGFVGSALLKQLNDLGFYHIVAGLRRDLPDMPAGIDGCYIGDIGNENDWGETLSNVDIVIHTAARNHVMNEKVTDSLAEFRQVNVDGTFNLAKQAAFAGVKRFIFISSLKVNGETNPLKSSLTEADPCNPKEPYAVSKYEAEQGLKKIAVETGLEIVIVRPPLIYGPGVKGNFLSMIQWVSKGIPLPLGAVFNQRSFIAIDNFVDFITHCIDHPAAANQVFLVSDGQDLSTTELLRRVGQELNRSARLIPVPAGLLVFCLSLLGKQAVGQRLLGSLHIDISKAHDLLNWNPPICVDEGIKRCVADIQTIEAPAEHKVLRFFDIVFSAVGLILTSPLLLVLTILGILDTGSPIFRQERVGKNKKYFVLVKFRTMQLDTESVASHLANTSSITRFGYFLRRAKLDELPQMWNVLKGDMSLVGPRPCLFSQDELIQERSVRNVFDGLPGITGLAQVNGIDMSTPKLLAQTDQKMLESLSLKAYFRYIFMTIAGKGAGDRVKN
ncbi:hybrid nucleoside-diphosphate sugar epimerase/sugar transferase [Desulfobacter curvatus]|uniref:hybrid nucleoside-diphosphate sugar epimerase/sugar transferase n=1 Tax=Desulfobacter curvatus TaxID=2290 RepID=UPI000525A224|nr:hybrid nucleoside-diphosphate sugar epimerase/sugar transferase [Desulfobacter curvatus]